jgi:Na+/H+ antiporter NhaD/arsenite permease-like protein
VAGQTEARAVFVVMVAAAVLSLVMNNIAAAAVLLPAVIGISRHTTLRPSRLLMPLAFGAHAGSLLALTGTPVNVIVAEAAADAGVGG